MGTQLSKKSLNKLWAKFASSARDSTHVTKLCEAARNYVLGVSHLLSFVEQGRILFSREHISSSQGYSAGSYILTK